MEAIEGKQEWRDKGCLIASLMIGQLTGGKGNQELMRREPYREDGKRSPCIAFFGEAVYVQADVMEYYGDAWQVG